VYTVYPSQNAGCSNITVPSQSLAVEGIVDNGPLSQYGWIDQVRDLDPLSQLALSLISISVYGYLFDPQEWHPTIHHAHYPCPPSSVQDHVERHESHKLDRFPHLGGSVLYQSNRRPRYLVGFRTLAQCKWVSYMPFYGTPIHVSNLSVQLIRCLIFRTESPTSPLSLDQTLGVSCSAQSSVWSSQPSSCAVDTSEPDTSRASILLTMSLARPDLIWVPASTLLNRSFPRTQNPPIKLKTQPRQHPHLSIRIPNPTAVPVSDGQPPTSTLSITMLEAYPSRSLPEVEVLRSSLHHIPIHIKINLPLNPLLVAPGTPALPAGDHYLSLLSPNLKSDPDNRSIPFL
jgi:hypothetical protein